MRMKAGLYVPILLSVCLFIVPFGCQPAQSSPSAATNMPRNVILLIGDGMGFEQVKAAGLYAHGRTGKLAFERLPVKGRMTTHCANRPITDSAAAGTAMAAGVKVNKGVVSVRIPGNGERLETVLEIAQRAGKRTGLVTTTQMCHATPAVFGAHVKSRSQFSDIAGHYLRDSRPNVLLGGKAPGGKGMTLDAARSAGYRTASTRAELGAAVKDGADRICGLFGDDHMPYEYEYMIRLDTGYDRMPHLSEMTAAALEVLERGDNGFFLMVESGRIDHACHKNLIRQCVYETLEFASTVRRVMEWADGRDDTLIVVTADHECGGLKVTGGADSGGFPAVKWSSDGHTAARVPIYAWGVGAEAVKQVSDNTDIYWLLLGESPAKAGAAEAAAQSNEAEPAGAGGSAGY